MIYEIRNTKTGKKYIGSSKSPKARIQEHKWQLDAENHHNGELQSDWNEFSFEFEVVSKGLKDREQKIFDDYIENGKWNDLYNTLKTVNGFGGLNHKEISKKEIENLILKKKTSSEIASELEITQKTLTAKVQKHFGCELGKVRKKIYKENAVFGRCKECGDPLKRTQKAFCSNECKFKNDEYNASRSSNVSNDENKKAVCPICGYESDDYKNIAGSLTKHENKKHGGTDVNFQIREKQKEEKLKCPECEWTTTDTENKSGAFTIHVNENHDGVLSFIKDHPKHKRILPIQKRKEEKRKKEEGVECQICGQHFDKLTNTHLKKHGITPTEYKIKYESKTYSESHYEKCLNHYKKNLKGNGHTYVFEPEKRNRRVHQKLWNR